MNAHPRLAPLDVFRQARLNTVSDNVVPNLRFGQPA